MKVVIVGAGGFIGRRLARVLAAAGHELTLVVRRPVEEALPKTTAVLADLAQPGFTLNLEAHADAVVYLAQSAAYRSFPDGARDMWAVNDTALLATLEWSRTHGVRMFAFTSSANVYAPSHEPIDEMVPPRPDTFYARSKYIAELLVGCYREYFDAVVFRVFTVYGPGQQGMLIPSLIDRVRAGQPIDVRGRRGLLLSPVHVDDVVSAIERVLPDQAPPCFQTLNLGGSEALSIVDVANHIADAAGRAVTFTYADAPEPGGWISNNSALERRLGSWRPVPFSAGIRTVISQENRAPDREHVDR